ncbi:MAG: glycosyltransferase family 4 protein [Promethearchaeota archaeon]
MDLNNILYIPTRYFPSISGAEFYFQRMAEILNAKFEYNIDIYTSNAIDFKALRDPKGRIIEENSKFFNKVNNLKINRFPINYGLSFQEKLDFIKNIDSYKSLNLSDDCLKKLLKNGPYLDGLINLILNSDEIDYDLVHATFFPYFNLIISLIIARFLNKPSVCTPFFHFSNPRYLEPNLNEVLSKFDLLIACTNIEKKKLLEKLNISEEKVKVIPMGVDYNIFESIHKTLFKDFYFKQKFFKQKETKYKLVLFCGYKNYEKGSISILKAIPFILKKIKKVYFVFIGPSTMAFNRELSRIQKINDVRIINFTPDNLTGYFDKKKLTAFEEADLFLMPSRSDAFGIAFLEAWSVGKPVIGCNIGATPEVIQNDVNGFLVEFDNPWDIAEKVVKLLKRKKLGKRIGLAGKKKVVNNYTWEIIANKTHKTYQNLIKKDY